MLQNPKLLISSQATAQLEKALANYPGKFLRITVMPGGCNGFEYNLKLDDAVLEDDQIFSPAPSVKVHVDSVSLDIIKGSELDYEAELIGAAFKLKNPNATTSCGCGNSFSV